MALHVGTGPSLLSFCFLILKLAFSLRSFLGFLEVLTPMQGPPLRPWLCRRPCTQALAVRVPSPLRESLQVVSTVARGGLFLSGTVDILSSGNVLSDFDQLLEGGLCLLDTEATPLHSVIKETCSPGSATLHCFLGGSCAPPPTGSPRPQGPLLKVSGCSQEASVVQLGGNEGEALYKGFSTPPLSQCFHSLALGQGPSCGHAGSVLPGHGAPLYVLSSLFVFFNFKIVFLNSNVKFSSLGTLTICMLDHLCVSNYLPLSLFYSWNSPASSLLFLLRHYLLCLFLGSFWL